MRSVPSSMMLYIGSGGIATLAHYVTALALVELAQVPPLGATMLGFIVGAIVKYCANYYVAFQSGAPHPVAIAKFLPTIAALWALNALLFAFLDEWAGIHYIVAQVLTTALLIPAGFLLSRGWVFAKC